MGIEFALMGFLIACTVLFLIALVKAKDKVENLQRLASEATKNLEEAKQRVVEAREKATAARENLEKLQTNLSSEGLSQKQAMEALKAIAAISYAFQDLDDDARFQFLANKLKEARAAWSLPPLSVTLSDEQDLRTAMRVLQCILETVNEKDPADRLTDRLRSLKERGLIQFSQEGLKEVYFLVSILKSTRSNDGDEQLSQLVNVLEESLLNKNR